LKNLELGEDEKYDFKQIILNLEKHRKFYEEYHITIPSSESTKIVTSESTITIQSELTTIFPSESTTTISSESTTKP